MNRDDSLRLLLNEFKEYGSSIIAHTSFYTEFTDIIAKSGMEKPIINEFISKLGYLIMVS